ncbi:MAG: putative Ig domain-containing protein, partial [Elusimicrobia bacterium]|nr:putative Ig domain-containing protein [Elusimicrobiota bacterium]
MIFSRYNSILLGFLIVLFHLSFLNANPVISTSTFKTFAIAQKPYTYTIQATGSGTLAYSLVTYPEGMTINGSTGLITWTPAHNQAGDNNVTACVTDTNGSTDTSFVVSVMGIPDTMIDNLKNINKGCRARPFAMFNIGDSITAASGWWYALCPANGGSAGKINYPWYYNIISNFNIRVAAPGMKAEFPFLDYYGSGVTYIDTRVSEWYPEITTVLYGTNDAIGREGITKYKTDMQSILNYLTAKKIIPILVTPPPINDTNTKISDLQPYLTAVKELASTNNIPVIDFFNAILTERPTDWYPVMIPDGIHPGGAYDNVNMDETAIHNDGECLVNYLMCRMYEFISSRMLDENYRAWVGIPETIYVRNGENLNYNLIEILNAGKLGITVNLTSDFGTVTPSQKDLASQTKSFATLSGGAITSDRVVSVTAAISGQSIVYTSTTQIKAIDLCGSFSDNFETGDFLTNWEKSKTGGVWSTQSVDGSNVLKFLGPGFQFSAINRYGTDTSAGYVRLKDKIYKDFSISFRSKDDSTTSNERGCSIIFGYQDPNNYYWINISGAGRIYKRVNAVTGPLSGSSYDFNYTGSVWHNIALSRQNGEIKINYDGSAVPALTCTDNDFLYGKIGIGVEADTSGSQTVYFDDVSIQLLSSSPIIVTSNLPNAIVVQSYTATIAASGGTAPYTWLASSPLPAGLTLSTAGAISGTPTAVGSTTTTFKVTDSVNAIATKDLCITVRPVPPLTITTANLTDGGVSSAYNATLTATGGTGPYTWTAVTGSTSLPAGLSLCSTGTISGVASSSGTYTFTIKAQDSTAPTPLESTKQFSITINPAPVTDGYRISGYVKATDTQQGIA